MTNSPEIKRDLVRPTISPENLPYFAHFRDPPGPSLFLGPSVTFPPSHIYFRSLQPLIVNFTSFHYFLTKTHSLPISITFYSKNVSGCPQTLIKVTKPQKRTKVTIPLKGTRWLPWSKSPRVAMVQNLLRKVEF